MREIKFRAWNKENKSWYHPIYEAHRGKLEEILMKPSTGHVVIRKHPNKDTYLDATQHSRFILMQYTNFKDKNGVEIYEGDVVKDEISRLEVVWHTKTGTWGFHKKHKETADFFSLAMLEPEIKLEIIGNVHENKELLI